ncbi:thioredoxin family protein [Bacillus sp. CDB3]|uniref:thioredoxin family protein n=1 Tax=Bacillus sp. CDB3 TaxID=360310 RepID=UPI0009D8683C|nr:thioredoxin family protein [Bacillus sp. CDB3]OQR53365.1 thiol reductase thioredoxin [Bacillus sp. CDB3]
MKKSILSILISVIAIAILIFVFNSKNLKRPNYTNISLQQYKSKIQSNEDFMIYVYKTTCGVCQEMKPSINEVITEGKINLIAMNADEEGNIDRSFFEEQKLQKSPTLLYYQNGKEVERLEGFHSKKELKEFVIHHQKK